MSAQGVFTRMKRIRFVDGQETSTPSVGFVACGDKTGFPIEVTGSSIREKFDKIAEIFFRVKDARYDGGSFEWTVAGSPAYCWSPSPPAATRVLDLADTVTINLQRRGYNKVGSDPYNGATYNAGDGVMYSDIGDNERGIFQTIWNGSSDYEIYHPVINAFSYHEDSAGRPGPEWWGDGVVGCKVFARFTGEIGVVKADPADGFYAATNKFYLGFEFSWYDYNPVLNFGGTSDLYTSIETGVFGPNFAFTCNYVLRLSTGGLTCPLYMGTSGADSGSQGGSDIIHLATKWFPYAKATGPAWNSATGAKL